MSELRILQLGISPPFQTVIETMSLRFGNRLTPGSSTEVSDDDLQYNPHHDHGSELHQTQRSWGRSFHRNVRKLSNTGTNTSEN